MFTRCPSCRSAFSITHEQLTIADGTVRCGVCEHVFDAHLYIFQQEEKAPSTPKFTPPEPKQVTISKPVELDHELIDDAIPVPPPSTENSVESLKEEKETEVPDVIVDQVLNLETDSSKLSFKNILGLLSLVALITGIFIQLAAIFNPTLLPKEIRTPICKLITCVTTLPKAVHEIEVLNRSVYTHPQIEKALMVELTMINRADFSQAYPIIHIRFLDISGTVIAAQKLSAEEYLEKEQTLDTAMEPDTPITINFKVEGIEADVVSYDFDFL